MRSNNFLWIFVFFSVFLLHPASAYLDCTPSQCDYGYTDNGIICEGGECVRECLLVQCDLNWMQVHSSDFGWVDEPNAVAKDSSSASYTPTNTSLCYQFEYEGPIIPGYPNIRFDAQATSPDCDLEGVGGFKTNANDWFRNTRFHLGNPEPGNIYDEMVKSVRWHSDDTATTAYKEEMANWSWHTNPTNPPRLDQYIYCAPTQVVCDATFEGGPTQKICKDNCFNNPTLGWVRQGYYRDQGNDNITMYNNQVCASNLVTHNAMQNATFLVYTSETINVPLNGTRDKTCDRINEPPIVYDVKVLPESPNAGQNLECTFNYTDVENFQEQGSTFEWWKNSANQNINARVLDKGNLSVSDSWFCKVTPSDGLTFGNQSTSTNTVTIQTTIKDPSFVIGNNLIWEAGGFYGDTEEIFNFDDTLQSAIDSCTPDQAGLCTIDLLFSSSATGTMDLSNMQIFYTQPQPNIQVVNLTLLETSGLSVVVGFEIVNELPFDRTVNWTLDMGDTNTIVSNLEIPLNASEDAFVFAQYTYGGAGTYVVNAIAFNETYSGSRLLNVTV